MAERMTEKKTTEIPGKISELRAEIESELTDKSDPEKIDVVSSDTDVGAGSRTDVGTGAKTDPGRTDVGTGVKTDPKQTDAKTDPKQTDAKTDPKQTDAKTDPKQIDVKPDPPPSKSLVVEDVPSPRVDGVKTDVGKDKIKPEVTRTDISRDKSDLDIINLARKQVPVKKTSSSLILLGERNKLATIGKNVFIHGDGNSLVHTHNLPGISKDTPKSTCSDVALIGCQDVQVAGDHVVVIGMKDRKIDVCLKGDPITVIGSQIMAGTLVTPPSYTNTDKQLNSEYIVVAHPTSRSIQITLPIIPDNGRLVTIKNISPQFSVFIIANCQIETETKGSWELFPNCSLDFIFLSVLNPERRGILKGETRTDVRAQYVEETKINRWLILSFYSPHDREKRRIV